MMVRRLWWIVLVRPSPSALAAGPYPADATLRFGELQVSGNLQSQNLIRTPDADTYQFIQNRNTARLRLDYEWLEGGKFIDKYNVPFIQNSNFSLLWRGVYDSIYTFTPGFLAEDATSTATDDVTAGRNLNDFDYATQVGHRRGPARQQSCSAINNLVLNSLGERGLDTLKFENQLREAYIDLKFRDVPLSIRGGTPADRVGRDRQLPHARPRELAQPHLALPAGDPGAGLRLGRDPPAVLDAQVPLRPGQRLEVLAELPRVVLEPGRLGSPAKQAFLPRPWGLPFFNPLNNLVDGAFFDGRAVRELAGPAGGGPRRGQNRCTSCVNGTQLFGQGDYNRNPMENSQVGVRYHGITPFGLEFTLNYFYQRFAGTTAPTTPRCACAGDPTNPSNQRALNQRRCAARPRHLPRRASSPTCTRSASRRTTPTRRSRRPSSGSRPSTISASRSSTSRRSA